MKKTGRIVRFPNGAYKKLEDIEKQMEKNKDYVLTKSEILRRIEPDICNALNKFHLIKKSKNNKEWYEENI